MKPQKLTYITVQPKTLFLVMKNWISDLKELKVKVEAMAEKSRKNCPPTVSNEEVKRVDNEIRLTCWLYKDFKMFLQTFLMTTRDQGSPQENSSLAMLLQVLWENFNSDKVSRGYLSSSIITNCFCNILVAFSISNRVQLYVLFKICFSRVWMLAEI